MTLPRAFSQNPLPFFLFAVLFFAFFPVQIGAESLSDCGLLTRNLKFGMSGDDVRILQMLLNNDVKTRVSDSGSGAKGFETMYFGAKTQSAVIKFQELYRAEVLLPFGLTSGSGFVGSYTRAKLITLCTPSTPVVTVKSSAPTIVTVTATPAATALPVTLSASPSVVVPADTPSAVELISSNEVPQLSSVWSYVVSPGDKFSVSGLGFASSGNTIHIGTLLIPDLAPIALGTLETVIPLDAPKGKFDLFVSSAKGESNRSFLIIVEKGTAPPVVKSFTPKSGVNGTVVSVTGDQFTKENNEIYFGYKPATGISSPDGKMLTFTLDMGLEGMPVGQSGVSTTTAPVWFYVVNTNGISNNGVFTLTF